MNLKFATLTFVALMIPSLNSFAGQATALPVTVQDGATTLEGSLYLPNGPNGPDGSMGPLPLVVVVHEWWGKNDYAETRAKRVADELGYAALAVDLYGAGKTAETPDAASALAKPFYQDAELGLKRLRAFLVAAPQVAAKHQATLENSQLAAIGYCFGATQVLNLARASETLPDGQKLLGVVSFHGGLGTTLKTHGSLKPKVLVLHGAADKMVTAEDVKTFQAEMKASHAQLEFKAYPGALHAFTNPKATEVGRKFKIPVAYDVHADKDSWIRMKAFLRGLFGK